MAAENANQTKNIFDKLVDLVWKADEFCTVKNPNAKSKRSSANH
jgi:hypothetical protein